MELRGSRLWGGRDVSDDQAEQVLNAVLDGGINYIDTSNDYGRSEEFIGRYISHRRGEYFLATKCGCVVINRGDHDETGHIWTKKNLLRNIESSLHLLRTDYIDVWQFHNPGVEQVEENDLIGVAEQVKKSGKVRWIGISTTIPHLGRFLEWGAFDVFQVPYSALQREHEEVISQIAHCRAGTVIRGGVAQGEPGVSGRSSAERWELWEKARLDELRDPNESRTVFLLRLTLSHPDLDTTIVGTIDMGHLAANLRAAEAGGLPADVYAEAKHRLDAACYV
jgi:aryl-alcohol dehydrogenase-like predicted oxidoreductase